MAINPVIFQDEGGIGVQVGEEKVYLNSDLIQSLHADYKAMDSRFLALDAENVSLREKLDREKESNMQKSIRYDVIASLIETPGAY